MLQSELNRSERTVEVAKQEREGLNVTLASSLLTGRVTVTELQPDSPAFGMLAPGDSIMEVNGVRVHSCEHAAGLIKESGDTRLRVILAGSPLAATFGVDFADMCTYAQLSRKAFVAAFCCAWWLVVRTLWLLPFQSSCYRCAARPCWVWVGA